MPAPTSDSSSHDDGLARLQHAAALLTGAGLADPTAVDPGIALLCLAAADELRPLVPQPNRILLDPAEVPGAVGDALAILAALPNELFATTAVLNAASDARTARALLTKST